MSRDLNKSAPNPVFDEWITLLTEASPADMRTLARWLAANDIHPPIKWEYRANQELTQPVQ